LRSVKEEKTNRQVAKAAGKAPINPKAFALAHMRTERGEPLDFLDRPYLVGPLVDPRVNHVVIACAQSGKTVTFLSKVFQQLIYPVGRKSRTVIYTFPTKEDVQEFSAARAKPMIEASPLLVQEIGDLDNVMVKQFRNGSTVYFRGTKTERTALSVPADILVHDELDRSQSDTLQMYADRTRASDDPRRYLFSTPTLPKFGVSAAWEGTDQHEWVWSCGECGAEQVFAPMDRSVSWREHLDLEAKVFRCCRCRAAVDRKWVVAGQWVPFAPAKVSIAGYHVTGIMPPQTTAVRLADEYGKAVFEELWVQGAIGIPQASGKAEITKESIIFGEWINTLQSEDRLFGGLDVGTKLDLVAGDGHGKIVAVHRLDDWGQVKSAVRTLKLRMLVVDSTPEPRAVQNLMAEFPGRVLAADYTLMTVDKDPFERVATEPRVRIHRTGILDWTRDQILMGPDGGDVWPALPYAEAEALKDHLTNTMRQLDLDKHGNPVATWVEVGPDHFRHAHAYYTVAAALMGGRKIGLSYVKQNTGTPHFLQELAAGQQTIKQDDEPVEMTDQLGRPVKVTRKDRMKRPILPPGSRVSKLY